MSTRPSTLAALVLALATVLPMAAIAEDALDGGLDELSMDLGEEASPTPPPAAPEPGTVPTGDACKYPVSLMWHGDAEGGLHQMGVSVKNANGQQVPGLTAQHFQVFHKGTPVPHDEQFQVSQSKNAFVQIETKEGEPEAPRGVDPIHYDVYFALDLTESMGTTYRLGSKDASRLEWSIKVVSMLVRPNKSGSSLFDEQDRVYISGFTNKLKTEFMTSATAQRDKITDALLALNEFTPTGRDAALYGSVQRSLEIIAGSADQYSDPARKRQAVLIVITDSFNGIDPVRGRRLRYCSDNDKFNDSLRQQIIETRQATGGNLKLYLLGIGQEGETETYSLTEPAGRRCRITKTEKEVLDSRSFRAIGDPKITSGGYFASEDPRRLAAWLTGQFEALKTAYQISYPPPADAPKPGSFKVLVTLNEDVCESEIIESTSFVPQAVASSDTSTNEVALFLASLLIALFFLPRSLMNLATLGNRPSPKRKTKKKKKGKGKKRKRKG